MSTLSNPSLAKPWLLFIFALTLQVATIGAERRAPVFTITLDPTKLSALSGYGYAVPITPPLSVLYVTSIDDNDHPGDSTLVLHEDGRRLGPAHSLHASISESGGGVYSHWGNWLYFSSSDGSDPRTNGRIYTVDVQQRLRFPLLTTMAVLLAAATAYLGIAWTRVCYLRWREDPSVTRATRIRIFFRNAAIGAPGETSRVRAFALSCMLCLVLAGASVLAPPSTVILDPLAFQSAEGHLVYQAIPRAASFPYDLRADSVSHPRGSSLTLYEDGVELAPPHSVHALIADEGAGRYSHWGDFLYFSSTDGTDPRTNGKDYVAVVIPVLMWPMWPIALALFAFLGMLAFPVRGGQLVVLLCYPVTYPSRVWHWAAVLSCGAAIACALLLLTWLYSPDRAPVESLAAYLPISDALGYDTCARHAALYGRFSSNQGLDFCARRMLYPSMLATLYAFTGGRADLALLIQAALVGAVVALIAAQVAFWCGILPAGLTAFLLFAYAHDFAIGLFLTEVAGLVCGVLGLSLLLAHARGGARILLFAGCVMVSVGLVARSGAMFIMPAILLAVALDCWRDGFQRNWSALTIALSGLAMGPLLQLWVLHAYQISLRSTFGNFSTVLYRLSVGGEDWTRAYLDHPELKLVVDAVAFQRLYAYALENIFAHPAVLLLSLWRALGSYFDSLYAFGGAALYQNLFNGLTLVGLVYCAKDWRQREHRLLLLLAAAEVFSAPWIVEDAGLRVFAVSVPVRIIFVALGSAWLARLCLRRLGPLMPAVPPLGFLRSTLPVARTGAVLAFALALMIVIGVIGTTWVPRPAPLRPLGCRLGTQEVVADLSHALLITNEDAPESWRPFSISKRRLMRSAEGTWYSADIKALNEPSMIIQAVPLAPDQFGRVYSYFLYWSNTAGFKPTDRPVSICFDRLHPVKIAGVDYQNVVSVTPLPLVRGGG